MNKAQILRIVIIWLICLSGTVSSQGTCANDWGPNLSVPRNQSFINCIEDYCKSFLVFDRPVETCYGKLSEWYFLHSDACHDILFQVYRPSSAGSKNYTLVGENLLTFTATTNCSNVGGAYADFRYTVPSELQIPVQPGDLIGWQDTNFAPAADTTKRLFLYEEPYDTIHFMEEQDRCTTVGQNCPWDASDGKVQVTRRQYSLNAQYEDGDPPMFENLPGYAQVSEHKPPGHFVFKVIASNNRNWNPVIPVALTYRIERITDCGGGVRTAEEPFIINKTTGELFTNIELDYEDLVCYYPGDREAYYNLTISAQQQEDGPESSEVLTVNVIDVNEKHDINNLPTTVVIDTAGIGTGYEVYDVNHEELEHQFFQTHDNESQWPRKNYTMVNADPALDVFQISRNNGRVTTKRPLSNWKGQNTTQLYITCTDGYYTTSPKVLTVVLSNLAQPPHLENLPNTISIPETTVTATNVYQVTSYTNRRGKSYYIRKVYPATNNYPGTDPFRIDTRDGWVSINNADFDYRLVTKYEVEIYVHSGLYESKPENLTVEITFVNRPPFWEETNYEGSIPELTPVGTPVPRIVLQSDDDDIPLGDWVDYVIEGDKAHVFHADNVTHKVYVVSQYELPCKTGEETFNLEIRVFDSFGETNRTGLTVKVTDVNNHVPEFDSIYYEGTVNELWTGGTSVPGVTVEVTDCDSNDKYGRVDIVVLEVYARKYFEVTPFHCATTCQEPLRLKQPISYSDYPNITFTLLASDRGSPRLNDTATVFITVEDENDHPPEYVSDFYDSEQRDDVPAGTSVTSLQVTDEDSDSNSNVSYILLLPDDHFTIDSDTGEIRTRKGLPEYHKHLLYAYARDHGQPELLSDPSIVRIDTYPPKEHLVDIHMDIRLEELKFILPDFLSKLNEEITPWLAKEERSYAVGDRSILTIYALTETPPATKDNLHYVKTFVHVDDLLEKLRTDIKGTPQDWLRGNDFSEYQVYEVQPTYPDWFVDTIPGIITLTLLCLLLLLLLLFIARQLYKQYLKSKVRPESPKPLPPSYEFDLTYKGYNHAPRRKMEAPPDIFVTDASEKFNPESGEAIPLVETYNPNQEWEDTILPGTPVSESHA